MVPVQTQSDARLDFQIQPHYEAPSVLQVKISKQCSDEHRVNEAAPLTVSQSWLRGSQIADKTKQKQQQKICQAFQE